MSIKEIPFGKIIDNKIILNGWKDFPEREIGEIRESEDESVQYFINRFNELDEKIEKLENEIAESENKGSFLMKLVHLKDLITKHDGLGDYEALEKRLLNQEELLSDIIHKNRERNTDIKKVLLEEMKVAVEKINWKEATAEIHDIKARWIKTGNPKEDVQQELEDEFWGLVDGFFEKKKQFYEDKKLLGEKRKKAYEEVVEKAKKVAELFGKERSDVTRSLKEEWKEIGNIPKEEYLPLQKVFNDLLKARPKQNFQGGDINAIKDQLQKYIQGEQSYSFKDLSGIKEQLKKFRAHNPETRKQRNESFADLQLLTERDFVDKLALKRFKNFKDLEKEKKSNIRISILEELINRDLTDLEKYQENSANFSGPTGSMLSLIEKKISQQQNKIEIKRKLLKILRDKK